MGTGYIKEKAAIQNQPQTSASKPVTLYAATQKMPWELNSKYSIPQVLKVEVTTHNTLIYGISAMGVVQGEVMIAAHDVVYAVSQDGYVKIQHKMNQNRPIRLIRCILPSSSDFGCALAGLASSVGGDGISHKTHLVINTSNPNDINEFTLPDNAQSQLTLDRGVPKYSPLPPRPLYVNELGPFIRGGAWYCAQLTEGDLTAGIDGIRSYIWDALTQCVYEVTSEGVGYVVGPITEISRYETVSVAEKDGVVFLTAGKVMYRITRVGNLQTFGTQREQPMFVARAACARRAHLINFPNGTEVILQDGSVSVCAATLGMFNAYFGALMGGRFLESTTAPKLAMSKTVFRCIVEYIHMGSVAIDTENQLATLAGLVEAAWYTGETDLSRGALYYILANVGYTHENHAMFIEDEQTRAADWYRAFATICDVMVEELQIRVHRHILAVLLSVNIRACIDNFPEEITLEHTKYLLNTINRRITQA